MSSRRALKAEKKSVTRTQLKTRSARRPTARGGKRVEPVSLRADNEDIDIDTGIGADLESGDKSPFKDDPIVDRRIIEGMLGDRAALMGEMHKLGYSQNAVLRRAAELGLSEALIRQVKGVAADLAGERPGRKATPVNLGARTCLSCDRVFLSTGPANRLCMRCRGGDAGLAQL